jgi:hypothetical protein
MPAVSIRPQAVERRIFFIVAFSLELRIVERASGEQVVVRLSNCRLSWGRGVMKKTEAK